MLRSVALIVCLLGLSLAVAQEENNGTTPKSSKSEPKYSETFSGSVVEIFYNGDNPKKTAPDDAITRITVSRSILGKPPEKRAFIIQPDTRVEGSLRMRARVTVGYVASDDGNVARLIVVRAAQRPQPKK